MIINIILIIIGIAAVLKGADWLTDGAVAIAKKFNMPDIVIGLTIVAFGTSMPELCVSMVSALNGTADMAVGNVIGSNIFNVCLIVGICSVITPIVVTRHTVKTDLPFAFLATFMLVVMLLDDTLSRLDGAIMVAIFCIFMYVTMRSALKKEDAQDKEESDTPEEKTQNNIIIKVLTNPLILVPAGLTALVVGSDVFVDNASSLAKQLGVSDAVIGLTILGFGTSLPELATSVVAATKGRTSMALGNVIGSCVFNILLILGLTSLVQPLSPEGITTTDIVVMALGASLMWLFSYTKYKMERWEGCVLCAVFVTYMTYIFINI